MELIKFLYTKIYKQFTLDFNKDLLTLTLDSIPDYAISTLNTSGTYFNSKQYTNAVEIKTSKCYKFSWDSIDIELTFFTVRKNKIKPKDAIALICFYITILNLYLRTIEKKKTLRIILAPFKTIKRLPKEKGLTLNSDHVNSGYSNGDHIFIYREEELFKVLVHEMIHHYDIDFKDTQYDEFFKDKYRIRSKKTQLRVFESYTDILAIMFSSFAYICFSLKNNNKKTEKRFTEYYVRVLENVKTNVRRYASHLF